MSFPLLSEFAVHPTEELLEEYSFGRVSEPALASLEEHLLVCVPCQNQLEEVDACIALIKNTARVWERDHQPSSAKARAWPGMLSARSAFLGAALAAGLVCAAFLGGRTLDRKSTRLNSSHIQKSRMPSSA